MYNSNKNKYLIYIMADTKIKFKTAISNAYKKIKQTESGIDFKDNPKEILKESDIIKQLIDKLNEKSTGAPVADGAGADADAGAGDGKAGTNNKIAISITKYNYGYYLNTIEDKEYALFFKLFLHIITAYLNYTEDNIVNILSYNIYLFRYIKLIYKIYKKNIIHINNKLCYIFYNIYLKLDNTESYNYTINDFKTNFTENTEIDYNVSCKILLTFSSIIKIDIDNNNLKIYKNNKIELDKQFDDSMNDKYPILFLLSNIFLKSYNFDYTKIFGIVQKIFSKKDYINHFSIIDDNITDDNINKNLSILKVYYDKKGNYLNKALDELKESETNTEKINKIIASLYEPYPAYDYLIINKDKDIIDIFKENPEIEDNYNIDNNSLELVEISKDKINFNNNTYKLIGFIDDNDEYKKIGDGEGGEDGAGGKDDDGAGAAGDGVGAGVLKYKLLIYKKDKEQEKKTEKDKEEKEPIITKLNSLYKNPDCEDININNIFNSCYLDSLFVALFSAKHKFMDDMLYNLKINSNFENRSSNTFTKDIYQFKYNIIYDDNDKKQLYYYASLIKKELIESYNNISMKKHKAICVYTNIRSYMKEYFNIYYKYDKIKITDIKVNNTSILTDNEVFNDIIADLKDTWTTKQLDITEYIILDIQKIFNDTFFNLPIKLHKNDTKVYKDDCNILTNDTIEEQIKKINGSIRHNDYSTITEYIIITVSDNTKDYNTKDYNMIDNAYKLYTYDDNMDFTVNDKITKTSNIRWSDDGYVIIGTENIYTKNLPKARYLHFNNITNIKINPSEKLFLNDKTYNENSKNSENTPFLSLQSIIIFEMGEKTKYSANSGHYTCIFKCNNKWYLYNDFSEPKVSIIKHEGNTDGDFNNITEEQKTKIVGLYYI